MLPEYNVRGFPPARVRAGCDRVVHRTCQDDLPHTATEMASSMRLESASTDTGSDRNDSDDDAEEDEEDNDEDDDEADAYERVELAVRQGDTSALLAIARDADCGLELPATWVLCQAIEAGITDSALIDGLLSAGAFPLCESDESDCDSPVSRVLRLRMDVSLFTKLINHALMSSSHEDTDEDEDRDRSMLLDAVKYLYQGPWLEPGTEPYHAVFRSLLRQRLEDAGVSVQRELPPLYGHRRYVEEYGALHEELRGHS